MWCKSVGLFLIIVATTYGSAMAQTTPPAPASPAPGASAPTSPAAAPATTTPGTEEGEDGGSREED